MIWKDKIKTNYYTGFIIHQVGYAFHHVALIKSAPVDIFELQKH